MTKPGDRSIGRIQGRQLNLRRRQNVPRRIFDRRKGQQNFTKKANPVEDLCAKLEAALLDQIARAAMGHAEIAESAAQAQDALDHFIVPIPFFR